MKLKYAQESKLPNKDGWILNYQYLLDIQNRMRSNDFMEVDLEDIELTLLAANEELHLYQ